MSYNQITIERKLKEFLEEDCSFKDITSQMIPPDSVSSARIVAKSEGYISGLDELTRLYNLLGVKTVLMKKDGEEIQKGDIIAKIEGTTQNILLGERVILNLITHMSAVTTTTRKFTNLIKNSGKKTKIACTRKTIPGLRIFEKKAVELGGGDTHRFSLDDMVLLKDTHLKFYEGKVEKLLKEAKQKVSFSKKVEVEIEKVEDILPAVHHGADIIMLDNMTPPQVKETVKILREKGLREKILIEVSGGITLENIGEYLIPEPDIISSSQLTQHPLEHVDLSLKFD